MISRTFKNTALTLVAATIAFGGAAVWYAAFAGYVSVKPGTSFSIKSWNAIINNVADHETRIASLSSRVASLASEKKAPSETPANPVATKTEPLASQNYRTACGYSSGTRYDNCCRVSVTTWAVICKYSYSMSHDWNKFPFDPFSETTKGDYSVSVMNDESNDFVVCRTNNATGTVECAYSSDMSRPWLKLPYNPF